MFTYEFPVFFGVTDPEMLILAEMPRMDDDSFHLMLNEYDRIADDALFHGCGTVKPEEVYEKAFRAFDGKGYKPYGMVNYGIFHVMPVDITPGQDALLYAGKLKNDAETLNRKEKLYRELIKDKDIHSIKTGSLTETGFKNDYITVNDYHDMMLMASCIYGSHDLLKSVNNMNPISLDDPRMLFSMEHENTTIVRFYVILDFMGSYDKGIQ